MRIHATGSTQANTQSTFTTISPSILHFPPKFHTDAASTPLSSDLDTLFLSIRLGKVRTGGVRTMAIVISHSSFIVPSSFKSCIDHDAHGWTLANPSLAAPNTTVRENNVHTRTQRHDTDYTVNFYGLFSVNTAHVLPRSCQRRVDPAIRLF